MNECYYCYDFRVQSIVFIDIHKQRPHIGGKRASFKTNDTCCLCAFPDVCISVRVCMHARLCVYVYLEVTCKKHDALPTSARCLPTVIKSVSARKRPSKHLTDPTRTDAHDHKRWRDTVCDFVLRFDSVISR